MHCRSLLRIRDWRPSSRRHDREACQRDRVFLAPDRAEEPTRPSPRIERLLSLQIHHHSISTIAISSFLFAENCIGYEYLLVDWDHVQMLSPPAVDGVQYREQACALLRSEILICRFIIDQCCRFPHQGHTWKTGNSELRQHVCQYRQGQSVSRPSF